MIKNLLLIWMLLGASACSALAAPQQCVRFEKALQAASELRGLPYSALPECLLLDKAELAKRTDALFAKDLETGKLERGEIALKLLGLIPPGFPYAECLAEDAQINVSAFYLPEEKAVLIPSWRETSEDLLVHEAVHALQDQRYDLQKLRSAAQETTDASLAVAALIEGDAVYIQEEFKKGKRRESRGGGSGSSRASPCALPAPLLHQYEFPYSSGLRYVLNAIKIEGPEAMEKLFKSPPRSTTEVLYRYSKRPELSSFRVRLPEVRLPEDQDAAGWNECEQDSVGEYTIRSILREQLRSTAALKGAIGWRGDRYRLYCSKDGKRSLLVWKTLWASRSEALEFFRTYIRAQRTRGWVENEKEEALPGAVRRWSADAGPGIQLRLEAEGEAVTYVGYVPSTQDLLSKRAPAKAALRATPTASAPNTD